MEAPVFSWHYAFRDQHHPIQWEAILAGIDWEVAHQIKVCEKFRGFGLTTPTKPPTVDVPFPSQLARGMA